jgi:hypothetical protein
MNIKETATVTLDRMSRYRLLRALLPVVRLHSEKDDSQESRAKYYVRINSLQRTLLFWRYAPSKFKGGILLNLLGYQLVRYLYLNLKFMLRPQIESKAIPRHVLRDICDAGCVTLPGALSEGDVTALLNFFGRNRADIREHFEDFSELLIANSRGPVKDTEDYRSIFEVIKKATHWDEAGAVLARKRIAITPYIAILHQRSRGDRPLQQDGQDTPHTDVCYPSFKVFYYLNDVDAGNGPFTYYKGSHAFGIARAVQEYRDSIRYFSGAKNAFTPMSAEAYADARGFVEEPQVGPKGSAVFFNVQGVHRRGDFLKDRDRERIVLLIDFRQVEATVQRFAA